MDGFTLIMKIIIVGGGIGGLSAYLALRKFLSDADVSIVVYEAHASPSSTRSSFGGGLGLAPNGLRAIASFAPNAAKRLDAGACHTPHLTFRNSHGALLGRMPTGTRARYGFDQVFCARAAVHEALLAEIADGVVHWGKAVEVVRPREDGVEVQLADGTKEFGDLVIGADGVRSVVRQAAVPGYPPQFDGLTGIGGFLQESALPPALRASFVDDPVAMTFGAQGFFGYGLVQPSSVSDRPVMWWSTFETDEPPARDTPLVDIRKQLLERHGKWSSPSDSMDVNVFPFIIETFCETRDASKPAAVQDLLLLPRFNTKRLPTWCSPGGRVILLGDAAHAMPPDSGQGASCAAEDAVVLALLLRHFLSSANATKDDQAATIQRVARAYDSLRVARVGKVLDFAERISGEKRQSRMSWWRERLRDNVLWVVCKLPLSRKDSWFGYDAEKEVKTFLTSST